MGVNGHRPEVDLTDMSADDLRRHFIALGGNPNTKTFRKAEIMAESAGRAKARQQLTSQQAAQPAWTRRIAQGMLVLVNGVAVAFTALLVLGGLSFGTIQVILAEISAVQLGLNAVSAQGASLAGYAAPIVLFYVVLLFIVEIVARDSYRSRRERTSLRQGLVRLAYLLGIYRKAEFVQEATLLDQASRAVRWMMYTQIAFGMLGRAQLGLSEIPAGTSWHAGIVYFVEHASLQVMLGTIGAGVMTVGLLMSIHFIVYFIYQTFTRLTGGIDPANFSEPVSAAFVVEQEVRAFYEAEILKLQRGKNHREIGPGS